VGEAGSTSWALKKRCNTTFIRRVCILTALKKEKRKLSLSFIHTHNIHSAISHYIPFVSHKYINIYYHFSIPPQSRTPALQNVDLSGGQMTMEQLEVIDNMEDLVAQRFVCVCVCFFI
jgi:hypothetical protein